MENSGYFFDTVAFSGNHQTSLVGVMMGDYDAACVGESIIYMMEEAGQLLKLVSDSEKGGILFHCSAGKDRTGILAMLLLMIAHAKREDILANYQPSYYNLMANPKIREAQEKYKLPLMSSDASTIAKVYDHIIDEYHDIESYLKACDLTDDDISKIYNRLVDKD